MSIFYSLLDVGYLSSRALFFESAKKGSTFVLCQEWRPFIKKALFQLFFFFNFGRHFFVMKGCFCHYLISNSNSITACTSVQYHYFLKKIHTLGWAFFLVRQFLSKGAFFKRPFFSTLEATKTIKNHPTMLSELPPYSANLPDKVLFDS